MTKYIIINQNDNVMVALENITSGTVVNDIVVLSDIVQGHKIALKDIKKGEDIIKYGFSIGHATADIKKGEHVHVHNVATNLGETLSYEYKPLFEKINIKSKDRSINVYKRPNGDIGIRNELWIIPTVGCIVGQARQIAKIFAQNHPELDNYDGIHVFSHPFGCSQMGDDHENTKETLQNISLHPNAGGVLVLGLGCENNQVKEFRESYQYDPNRIKFLVMQEVDDEISEANQLLETLYQILIKDKRQKTPISQLKVGVKCGGSDGFSGITGNPLLGKFTDYLTHYGGSIVQTEVPEMFGAEKIFMQRAQNKEVFEKIVKMINDFKEYYNSHNQVIYDNPSPGNKNGGITTLEDKSLGCTQKGGQAIVVDALEHTQRVTKKGLNLISAPGNDLVSVTTLAMSGAHLVLFSTGRGTPFGGFVPTIKVSTNTDIYNRKKSWIDFNAGQLVDGKVMDDVLEEFIDFIVDTANGRKTNNEQNEFREIAIFKDGVFL